MSKSLVHKPNLYCPKCKRQVATIIERYKTPITETRKWDGNNYILIDSNIDNIEFTQHCFKCDSKLEEWLPVSKRWKVNPKLLKTKKETINIYNPKLQKKLIKNSKEV